MKLLESHSFFSHAGLFNLCIVVLVAVNGRLIIENLMKYGLLINSNFWFSSRSLRDWPLLMCCVSLLFFPLAAYTVEKLAWKRRISDPVVITLHVIITTTAILYPVFMILIVDSVVLSGVSLMLCACINWLKLTSFVHTSYDMRSLMNSTDKGGTKSESLDIELFYDADFKSLVYFLLAPTLCYQIRYPRTAFIRKGWVLRQLIKLIIFTGLMGFIIEQVSMPFLRILPLFNLASL
ncbi:putative diacylglycerol O-acyltransferase [Helianthus anomalus]